MSTLTGVMVELLARMPEKFIWRFARRYIAGSDIDAARIVMKELNHDGLFATMDVLGEDTESVEDAKRAVLEYEELIAAVIESGTKANLSVKLTQLGLKISVDQALKRASRIASEANKRDIFFRIDIEDSSTTDDTFRIYDTLRNELPLVGAAVQAYLKRTADDVQKMLSTGPVNIRVCKGIYIESAKIALKNRQAIRENFLKIVLQLFDGGGYAAIATHDSWLIDAILPEIRKRNLSTDQYEFQMLYGVGKGLRAKLLAAGHRVRIYVPYGVAWKAYSFRRFKENPKLAWYVIKNLLSFH